MILQGIWRSPGLRLAGQIYLNLHVCPGFQRRSHTPNMTASPVNTLTMVATIKRAVSNILRYPELVTVFNADQFSIAKQATCERSVNPVQPSLFFQIYGAFTDTSAMDQAYQFLCIAKLH